MGDTRAYREAAVARATTGPGVASAADRQAAFANDGVPEAARALVAKVARDATRVADEDVAAAAAALGDDAVFELVICAAMGEATRQLDAAMAALAAYDAENEVER